MENEIMEKFLSINEQNCNPTIGKYSSKKETFYEDIKQWQEEKNNKDHIIKPIQFTFEITNRCNCNCKDCGMSANSIKVGKTKLNDTVQKLYEKYVPQATREYIDDKVAREISTRERTRRADRTVRREESQLEESEIV